MSVEMGGDKGCQIHTGRMEVLLVTTVCKKYSYLNIYCENF